jgi:[acyl-carrier-protein] S-malonyltransferase
MKKKAYIFPAFITEFTGKEISFLEDYNVDINNYLSNISNSLNIDLPEFSYEHEFYKEELNSQLIAYSFSCAFSDILKSKQIVPDYVAGYSMGIYASLYASGSIDFLQGAQLIFKAYNLVKTLSDEGLYGMGAVVGLTYSELSELILKYNYDLEIINTNNERSLVIAGKRRDIKELLNTAKYEGALSTGELTVNTPYHSRFIKQFANSFKSDVDQVDISDAKIPIISTFDQRLLFKVSDVRSELVINLTEFIHWEKTILKLLDLGVEEMYECGAGKDLKKISRFIHGNYKIKSVYKV